MRLVFGKDTAKVAVLVQTKTVAEWVILPKHVGITITMMMMMMIIIIIVIKIIMPY